jgi:hypothetical protein
MGEKFQLTWTKVHVARWRINVSVDSAWAVNLPQQGPCTVPTMDWVCTDV